MTFNNLKSASLRNLPGFEVRSVLLFTALALGGASASMAQLRADSPAPLGTTQSGAATGVQAAPTTAPRGNALDAAFDRTDTNRDGQLSAQEAQAMPAISEKFAAFDTDGSGQLSRQEFHQAAGRKPQ